MMTPTAPIPHGWLLTHNDQIAALGWGDPPESVDAQVIDAAGKTLLPGFIDVHVHGGAGSEAMDASADALRTMAQFYGAHGVTSFLATTWTDSRPRIQGALEMIAATQGRQPNGAT